MTTRTWQAALGGAALLLVTACGADADTTTSDTAPSPTATSETPTPAAPSSAQPTTTAPASPDPGPTPEDVALAHDFVAFASDPSGSTAAAVPFAAQVQLGLGDKLVATLDEASLPQASAWTVRQRIFRGSSGQFNALTLIDRHADEAGPQAVDEPESAFDVELGDHPRCVGPPVRAPEGLEDHRRVSIQPSSRSHDSCLSWFTVDLFVDDDGQIAAATLDLWEP